MTYKITLIDTGEEFTWDEWVAKKPEERYKLNIQHKGIRVETV